jgi:3-phosphoshikimate 1-carboxyvinyltransferase
MAKNVSVHSEGLSSLKMSSVPLFAGNSGTTIRLLSGLLAGRPFESVLDGDNSLRKRPMKRVTEPLATMGAGIEYLAVAGSGNNGETRPQTPGYAPFSIRGGKLTGQNFYLKVASAQVETAILLAGLQAEGTTTVNLPSAVRDHTRRMFEHLHVPFSQTGDRTMSVKRLTTPPKAKPIYVPADMSSAAFFMVAACLVEASDLLLTDVGMNPGRLLALEVLQSMGAAISIENPRHFGLEPVADLRIKYAGRLKGTSISAKEIARGIDEIPILALAGALCQGEFAVSGAEELRHKESDRLEAITENLQAAGAEILVKQDGFVIQGKSSLAGGSRWKTHEDHRLAMTGLIANLVCQDKLAIEETESVKISYPGFAVDLAHLCQ